MSDEDAREWQSEHDLALWREAGDVQALYRYQVHVQPDGMTVLCQGVERRDLDRGRTELVLEDAWVYDALMSPRIVARVTVVCDGFTLVELREAEL